MKNENKAINKIILFSVIFLIVGGVAGYFIGEHFARPHFSAINGNFQINDTVKAEITSFFGSGPTTEQLNSYCQSNPRYCMEYCRSINPSDELCKQIQLNYSYRGGTPTG